MGVKAVNTPRRVDRLNDGLAHCLGEASRRREHSGIRLKRRDEFDELHDGNGIDCRTGA
jgi:hypothetical protein